MNHSTVEFFFDPVSPYAWLASKQLRKITDAGLRIDCQPVLFAGLLNAHGQKGPAEIEAKRRYVFADAVREADRSGCAFKGPPTHPFNPLRALRMCIALDDPSERLTFAKALLKAAWEDEKELGDASTLESIADACGFADHKLGNAAEQAEIKNRLMQATTRAIELGVFGVPTFLFRGELFWGSDRIDALLWRADHPAKDDGKLQDFLSRQASAQRKS
jgi:2-hydroxychromene-2-carboxylate isomerase